MRTGPARRAGVRRPFVCEYCSRLCAIERFWGHKEQADLRLRRTGGQNVGLGANAAAR